MLVKKYSALQVKRNLTIRCILVSFPGHFFLGGVLIFCREDTVC